MKSGQPNIRAVLRPGSDRGLILEFRKLQKSYGSVVALREISLDVPAGGVLALLGPNGAGKSTLFGCLLGFTGADRGEILFDGRPLHAGDRSKFGYLSERVALYPNRSVWENGLFFAQLRGAGAGDLEVQLQRLGLESFRDRKARQLSKGMLQRLGLAVALCGQPEVLILDEPFNGLDPLQLESLQAVLIQEHARGATLVIATHTISAVEPIATHAAILIHGRVAARGSFEQLRLDERTRSLEAIYQAIARRSCAAVEEQEAA